MPEKTSANPFAAEQVFSTEKEGKRELLDGLFAYRTKVMDLYGMVENVTHETELVSVLTKMAEMQSELGDPEYKQALDALEAVGDKAALAQAQARTGLIEEAMKTTRSREISGFSRAMTLCEVAQAQARAGDENFKENLEEAQDILDREENYNRRIQIRIAIAELQIKAGNPEYRKTMDVAFRTAGMDSVGLYGLQKEIIQILAESGDLEYARELWENMPRYEGVNSALAQIAKAEAKTGDPKSTETFRLALNPEFCKPRGWELVEIALAQAEARDPGYKETIEKLLAEKDLAEEPAYYCRRLADVARIQAAAGDPEYKETMRKAYETAATIKEKYEDERYLDLGYGETIMVDQKEIDHKEEIKQKLQDSWVVKDAKKRYEEKKAEGILEPEVLPKRPHREHALMYIAREQAKIGDIQEAMRTANGLEEWYYRNLVYADVAETQMKKITESFKQKGLSFEELGPEQAKALLAQAVENQDKQTIEKIGSLLSPKEHAEAGETYGEEVAKQLHKGWEETHNKQQRVIRLIKESAKKGNSKKER